MNPKEIKVGDKLVWLDPDNVTSQIVTVDAIEYEIAVCTGETGCDMEVFDSELYTLDSILCCEKCGNIDVEKTAWVYLNSSVLSTNTDVTSLWCPNCDRGGIKGKTVKQYLDDTDNK